MFLFLGFIQFFSIKIFWGDFFLQGSKDKGAVVDHGVKPTEANFTFDILIQKLF